MPNEESIPGPTRETAAGLSPIKLAEVPAHAGDEMRLAVARWVGPLAAALGVSAACWISLFIAIPPAEQNVPLIDDWAFGGGAVTFAEGKPIDYYGWASMPLLGQWIWAAPFVWFSGSYTMLRVATIAASWLGLAAFYDLLTHRFEVRPAVAGIATAALAVEPLFFLLQGTFMTDVPCLSFALVSLALYERAARSGHRMLWLLAAVFALLAVTTRQNMICVPMAAAIAIACGPARRRPAAWLAVLVPFLTGIAVYIWFQQRLDTNPVPFRFAAPLTVLVLPYVIVLICGMASLPVLLLDPRPRDWRGFLGWSVLLLACAGYWFYYQAELPYGGLYPYIHGMLTPYGAYSALMPGTRPPVAGDISRWFLTVVGCLAGAAVLDRLVPCLRTQRLWGMLFWFTLLQVPVLLLAPWLYDRYVLPFIPAALVVAAIGTSKIHRWAWIWAGGIIVLVAGMSTCLMHDWLAWNVARWEIGREALRVRHIEPRRIEGGLEWDGLHNQVVHGYSWRPAPRLVLTDIWKQGWFPTVTGEYAISFSKLPNSAIIESRSFPTWLPPGRQEMLLLEYRRERAAAVK
jgi:hypothetical protein